MAFATCMVAQGVSVLTDEMLENIVDMKATPHVDFGECITRLTDPP